MRWGRDQHCRLAAGFAAAVLSLPAFADESTGFYLSSLAGASRPGGQNATVNVNNVGSASGNLQLGTGFVFAQTGGYAFANGLRPELEISNRHNSGNTVGENGLTVMGNLWYQIDQNGYFFYVGGGFGDAELHASTQGNSASDNGPAWQLGTGFGFAVTPHWAVSVDYRHLETLDRSTFNFQGGNLQTGYSSNAGMIGLRYYFGGKLADAAIMPVDPVKVVPLSH
ncbi:MAG: porin family protein [Nevskia sp.]|nr:porin family protein [Nevskia sp.]